MIHMDVIQYYSCCQKSNTTIIPMQIAWVVGFFLFVLSVTVLVTWLLLCAVAAARVFAI